MALVREEQPIVTVFGASGFLGRHVVRALARNGWRIRAACRRPDLAAHLQPLGGVGQIMPMQANLRYRASVDRAVAGADAVVNLVGILAASGRQTYAAVQAFGARAVAEALAERGQDPEALSVEFTNPLPTLRKPPGAEPVVVEDVSTDAAGRRFAARIAMPLGSGNVHRQTLTGRLHQLAQVPVPVRELLPVRAQAPELRPCSLSNR